MPATIDTQLVSRAEAANMLSVSVRTLSRLILYGRIPCIRMGVGGRTVKLAVSDIEKYIADRRID